MDNHNEEREFLDCQPKEEPRRSSDDHEEPLAPSGIVTPAASARLRPRTYDGTSSWREYHSHFERVCRLNGWWQALRLDYLWVNLEGAALSYVESLPASRTADYVTLCRSMEERFGESQLAEVFRSELRGRKRRKGESLPALGQEVRRLVQYAYPGVGYDALEEIAVERFREALDDREQRMTIRQSHPRTLEEAVKAATDMESWQVSEGTQSTKQVRAVSTSAEGSEVGELKALIQQVLQAVRKSNRPPRQVAEGPPKCFRCGKEGHYARGCPQGNGKQSQ